MKQQCVFQSSYRTASTDPTAQSESFQHTFWIAFDARSGRPRCYTCSLPYYRSHLYIERMAHRQTKKALTKQIIGLSTSCCRLMIGLSAGRVSVSGKEGVAVLIPSNQFELGLNLKHIFFACLAPSA